MRRIFTAIVLTICALPAFCKTNPRVCANGPDRQENTRLVAAQNRALRPAARRTAAPAANALRVTGDLVLMDPAGGIVSERNAFNLDGRRVRMTVNSAGAYAYETTGVQFQEPAPGDRALGDLGDDDTADSALPFAFPFFGQRYERVWINSDGNLTFDRPDTASSDRSLGRFASGAPRIAPLFMDLDPTRGGAVLVSSSPERFTVTWQGVPEYRAAGAGSPNTVQVSLFPDGRVEFHYQGITTTEAVVGLSRGRLASTATIVRFADASPATFTGSFAERFTQGNDIDMVTLAQRFYASMSDAYDYLVVYNTMGIPAADGAVAYEVTVRNDRTGYGDREVNDGEQYGSRRRLQAVINMGQLNQYPADPNGLVPARASVRDTPLSILGHEAGHLFLAFASVRDADFPAARPMLGLQGAHWGFTFNSEASLLEGNRISDGGVDATPRFETVGTSEGYSALDQYLMGLRAPADVPPTFLVENSTLGPFSRTPQTGVRFDGVRRDITVDEIIAAEGRRSPDHTVAQRRFRFAFIVLSAAGTPPTPEQVEQIDRYRREFEPYFARVTGQRATAETSLRESLAFVAQPAAGVLAGQAAALVLEAGQASPLARTVRLRAEPAAGLTIPETVTLLPGATLVNVPVTGTRPGVTLLTAQLDGHETALTRVQVAAGASALSVFLREGDRQVVRPGRPLEPVIVRAADVNRVPYPGAVIRAEAIGGTVDRASARTGANGEAAFVFRPGEGPVHELLLTVEGSAALPQRAVFLSRPVLADGGLVNAASYGPGLSPGGLAALFGAYLTAEAGPFVLAYPGAAGLGGTDVFVGGRAARLLYAGERQINLVIPDTLAPGVHEVEIRNALGVSVSKPVSVEEVWPGIFSARLDGDTIRVVATGLGVTRQPVRARVNGVEALVRGTAVLATGEVEVRVAAPAGLAGPATVEITAGARTSNVAMVRR